MQIFAQEDILERPPTRENVVSMYIAILGRVPESETVIADKLLTCSNLHSLRRSFFLSNEFRTEVIPQFNLSIWHNQPSIEIKINDPLSYFNCIAQWTKVGEENLFPYTASMINCTQQPPINNMALKIDLDRSDDLLFQTLYWYFNLGFRHFSLNYLALSPLAQKHLNMFTERAGELITLQENSAVFPEIIEWIFPTNGRQFLCLPNGKQLINLLENCTSASYVLLPKCFYSGKNPHAQFHPPLLPTDEILIYRSEISLTKPFCVFKKTKTETSSTSFIIKDAYVSEYSPLEQAEEGSASLFPYNDPLPFKYACYNFIRFCNLNTKFFQKQLSFQSVFVPEILTSMIPEVLLAKKNALYACVPKVGSSTIKNAIFSLAIERFCDRCKDNSETDLTFCMNYNPWQALCSAENYKFTSVRNPYARALSMFLHLIVKEPTYRNFFNIKPQNTIPAFSKFLKCLKFFPERERDPHFRSQSVCTQIAHIKYNKIIHLEKFDEEFQEVMDVLGISGKSQDYNINNHQTQASSKISNYYTQECVDLVQEIFRDDFINFGYDLTPTFTIKTPTDFVEANIGRTSDFYFIFHPGEGMYDPEPEGIWSSSKSKFGIEFPQTNVTYAVNFEGCFFPIAGDYFIKNNESTLAQNNFTPPKEIKKIHFRFAPKETVEYFSIEIPNALSPKSTNESKDERVLGFLFKKISIQKLSE